MAKSQMRQFRKTMAEMQALQAKYGGVPENLAAWVINHFSEKSDVISAFGKGDNLHSEEKMAVISDELERRGIQVKTKPTS